MMQQLWWKILILMKKVDYYKTFLLYIKMGKTTYYKKNKQRNNIKYSKRLLWKYENNKEVLREKAKNLHRELSKEEKNIEREHGRNRYKNISEQRKQRLKEYQKIIVKLIKLKSYDFGKTVY